MRTRTRVPSSYVRLAEQYLNNALTSDDYSLAVVTMYKHETADLDVFVTRALNRLFTAALEYCADSAARDGREVDEWRLVEAATTFLARADRLD